MQCFIRSNSFLFQIPRGALQNTRSMNSFSLQQREGGAGNREILATRPDKDLERLSGQPRRLSRISSARLVLKAHHGHVAGSSGGHFIPTSPVELFVPPAPVPEALRSLRFALS